MADMFDFEPHEDDLSQQDKQGAHHDSDDDIIEIDDVSFPFAGLLPRTNAPRVNCPE